MLALNPIPAYPVSSNNVRGFHAYGHANRRKRWGKQANAKALVLKHDITFFQETKLLDREDHFLRRFCLRDIFPTTAVFPKPLQAWQRLSLPFWITFMTMKLSLFPPCSRGGQFV